MEGKVNRQRWGNKVGSQTDECVLAEISTRAEGKDVVVQSQDTRTGCVSETGARSTSSSFDQIRDLTTSQAA